MVAGRLPKTLYFMNNYYGLYKYRPINKNLIDSIVKNELYFSEPSQLNDPFDCQIDIKKSLSKAIEVTTETKKENLILLLEETDGLDEWQTNIKQFGICSFSLSREGNILSNPLMWSHYADEHKGVCLYYEFPNEFINYEKNKIIGIAEVEYSYNPLTEWFIENADVFGEWGIEKFFFELGKNTLRNKSLPWKYEEEVRIVRPNKGTFEIDPKSLKQICFGLNTSTEDMELIKKITHHTNNNVSFCQATHGETDFGITIKEI